MRKSYLEPTVIDFGSITDCTFIVSGPLSSNGRATTTRGADGLWICTDTPADSHKPGHKNYIQLECDKFGEFSHPSSAGS